MIEYEAREMLLFESESFSLNSTESYKLSDIKVSPKLSIWLSISFKFSIRLQTTFFGIVYFLIRLFYFDMKRYRGLETGSGFLGATLHPKDNVDCFFIKGYWHSFMLSALFFAFLAEWIFSASTPNVGCFLYSKVGAI